MLSKFLIVLLLLGCAPKVIHIKENKPEIIQPETRKNAFKRAGKYVIACYKGHDALWICDEGTVKHFQEIANRYYYVWFADGREGKYETVRTTSYKSEKQPVTKTDQE